MRILSLLLFLFLTADFATAQCVPDTSITHNDPGVYPDTITGLPHSYVGVAYATTIQIKVLTDTVVGGLTVPVDSIVVNGVSGLPSGFTYVCTPSSCSFPGGSDACIYLQGLPPTGAMVGSYPIIVQVTAYGVLFGTPTNVPANITGYSIEIDANTGISDLNTPTFTVGQNSPNPAHEYTVIPVNLTRNEEVTVTVSNLLGKKVIEHTYNLNKGRNTINVDVHGLQQGIYLYTISVGRNNTTRRMIISNE